MNGMRNLGCCVVLTGLLAVLLTGCTPYKDAKKDSAGQKKEMAHPKEGPRGGAFAEWGEEEYHVEFTVDTGAKAAVVYLLAGEVKDGKFVDVKLDPAKVTDMKLTLKEPKLSLDLTYDAKRSGTDKTVFVATHDTFAKAGDYKGEIGGTVNGKPLNGEFPHKH